MENYEKKYKEALGRANAKIETYNHLGNTSAVKSICEIFPELKESEDDRIKTNIIRLLRFVRDTYHQYYDECNEAIAWLEKQRKEWNADDLLKRNQIMDILQEYNRTELIAWLEKQGEQKPADKPKFNVDDWIVRELDNTCHQIKKCILNVTNNKYGYDLTSGGYISSQDANFYHLWTIKDAKDGDVLSFNDGHKNDSIELIKSVTDKKIEFWFCLTNGNRYEVFDGIIPYTNFASRESATPATKEQRDILFQKMKESGYEWNPEKKELKKIEQNFTPKYKTGDCIEYRGEKYKITKVNVLPHNFIYDVSLIEAPSDSEEVVTSIGMTAEEQMFKIELKSDWSEEDERMCQETIDWFEKKCFPYALESENPARKSIKWLKSLKQRMKGE